MFALGGGPGPRKRKDPPPTEFSCTQPRRSGWVSARVHANPPATTRIEIMAAVTHNRAKRVLVLALLVGGGAIALRGTLPAGAAPRSQTASELIDAVNQFRAGRGMDPLAVDPILMLVSQRQNDYSISIGQITHYGPDGSRPRDQAIAAGYGGGSTVFVSQNIVMGTGLTPAEAVQIWTGDEPHLNTMIGQYYRDVGAAVGERDGMVYYTLMTGYVAGGISARSTVPVAQPPAPVYVPPPIVVSTAQADGSVVHVVQSGQVLWAIADAYGVRIQDVVVLNRLGMNQVLYPGDELTIRAALTPSATVTSTASPSVTPTARPSPAPTQGPPPDTDSLEAMTTTDRSEAMGRTALILVWVGVVAIGIVLATRRSEIGRR